MVKTTTQKAGNARRRAARLRNANSRSSYLSYPWGKVTQPTDLDKEIAEQAEWRREWQAHLAQLKKVRGY